MAKIAAIQLVSTPSIEDNFSRVDGLLSEHDCDEPRLVILPECFASFGGRDSDLFALAKTQGDVIIERLQALAQQHKCWLVAGTIPLLSQDQQRFRAACLCIDADGVVQARYDKIHLFDVQVDDSTGSYLESRYTEPGDTVVTLPTPFGTVGLAVCYDVRFAGLFQAMQGVDIITLPSAFTQKTGAAHWHALLQARSIEMQCYLVGANQGGIHANGRETFGNSVIYSPWGDNLAMLEKGEGYISASPDLAKLASIRQSMPVQAHTKFRSTFVESR
ncbi:carbon-nitrogen hydrolase family protein [Alteromonas flava]|uniref:carbon-nitrogen hydrolase family protein n=1 Tax=Alteromonas flava TaxID=2048003 RepID=UPI000C285284|nr:carbon-nitrogen hydrolase family protein [Alteromonas flava]